MAIRLLTLFSFMTVSLMGQDSTAVTDLRSVFMDLPVELDYHTILQKASVHEKFQNGVKGSLNEKKLNQPQEIKLPFVEYTLYPEGKCTNCYISYIPEESERKISLVLNFEDFDQTHYNELLKRILAKITPQVKKIEQNIGDLQNWGTLLFLDEKQYTPRVRIGEPTKAFTQITIDYISVLESERE